MIWASPPPTTSCARERNGGKGSRAGSWADGVGGFYRLLFFRFMVRKNHGSMGFCGILRDFTGIVW